MTASKTSHRQSKKQRCEERILANAIALFRKRGIRKTRLAEVASASGVSPATLFNYFPTKSQLAEAWVRGEVESSLIEAVAESVSRDRSLRSALRGACRSVARASAGEPALRAEAWREAGRALGRPLSDRGPLLAGLRVEQERERVRGDLPCEDLADMLIEAIEGGLIAGLRSSGFEAAADEELEALLSQKIRERVDLILDGARKRNERVQLPASTRATRPGPNR